MTQSIDRHLINILQEIVDEDELKLIQYLLSNTIIDTKIEKADIKSPFMSNVGTPQGDGLSPVLFTVYLEHALREVRSVIGDPKSTIDEKIPREIAYADDIDFIGTEFIDIDEIQKSLKNFQLMVNVDKTEYTTIHRQESSWKTTKKVGSLISDTDDVERRKQLSNAALHKLKNVWIRQDKIKRNIKIKLYRALVKSILTYNCGTWALTQSEINKLDAFHRKQLRKVLNIYYPVKISNRSLYEKCHEKPLSIFITESRWKLFGHILRRDKNIPANQSMELYYTKFGDQYKGRPVTTLPTVLNKDLSRLKSNLSLRTTEDLSHLRSMAQDRKVWNSLTREIVQVAEASSSDDKDAKGP